MTHHRLYIGDALDVLRTLPDESVNCVVTSPPYWGLRDYGIPGQIGLERTPEEYVARMVEVFREARRVLRKDGTLWLNLGDSYANDGKWGGETGGKQAYLPDSDRKRVGREKRVTGVKPKDLVGIPWRMAFALQADGWWLRSDIIWAKPNPMPESVTDRPTRAHEYLFLFAKSERYYYDADAIRELAAIGDHYRNVDSLYQAPGQPEHRGLHRAAQKAPAGWDTGSGAHGTIHQEGRSKPDKQRGHSRRHAGFNARWDLMTHAEQAQFGRNKRDVWTIATQPFPEAHFATFPEDLVGPPILAGCPEGG